MLNNKRIKIRFNTGYPKVSNKKWRVLVEELLPISDKTYPEDREYLVDDVVCMTYAHTTLDYVTNETGERVLKHHFTAEGKVNFKPYYGDTEYIIAIITENK